MNGVDPRLAWIALSIGGVGCGGATSGQPRTVGPAANTADVDMDFSDLQELIRVSRGQTVESLLSPLPAAMRDGARFTGLPENEDA